MSVSPEHKKLCNGATKASLVNGTTNGRHCARKSSRSDLEEFDAIFPQIAEDLTLEGTQNKEIADAVTRFKEVLEYNVPHGKKNRGLIVAASFRLLASRDQLTDANMRLARILGWCIEMMQAFFLVADDIMDQSTMRRGQPCWYKVKGIGNIAINDSFYLESAIYHILRKYFRDQRYYVDIVDMFHETTRQTITGQGLDLTTSTTGGALDISKFSMERYSAIVKWKTAFYSFYLPVALAMYMAGIDDSESHASAKKILLRMGHFFQVQDDFLDCYGDPAVTGKVGTDIEEMKCSWLVNQALIRATPEQRKLLEENYGLSDPANVSRIKGLYDDLDLKAVYAEYEETSYKELLEMIETTSGNLPKELFVTFSNKIYKRDR